MSDSDQTKTDGAAVPDEEYGQLSFNFGKAEAGIIRNLESETFAVNKPETETVKQAPAEDDEEYEQLSLDFGKMSESDEGKPGEAGSEEKGAEGSDAEQIPLSEADSANGDVSGGDAAEDIKTANVAISDSDTGAAEAEGTDATVESVNKSHIGRKLLIAAAVIIAAVYCGGIYFFTSHFLPNSNVQGVDISYLNAADAENRLQSELVYDSILLKGRTGDEKLDLSGTDAVKTFSLIQESIEEQNKFAWFTAFFDKARDIGIALSVSCDEEALNFAIASLNILNPDNITLPTDAHPKLNTDTNLYEVEAETEGNNINTEVFKEAVHEALRAGSRELDLDEAGVYVEPIMRSDDIVLTDQIAWMNAINAAGASLDMGAGLVIAVNGELVGALVGADGMADGQLVRDYVTWLAVTYNTASPDKTRSFINHNNEEKIIKTGYGWQLNEDKTYAQLYELINKVLTDTTVLHLQDAQADTAVGEALSSDSGNANAAELTDTVDASAASSAEFGVSENSDASSAEAGAALNPEDYAIKAVWKRAAAKHEENDLGNTYVEIDLGEQNVYIYVDGSCVLTTPCVSGRMVQGRITPEGMYQIQYKQKERYLTGRNPDGSISYRSYVHYWMPFNGGIGLHDATWRSKFGGTLYVHGGSHGCINLPLDMAQQIYDIVYPGMPVICYY